MLMVIFGAGASSDSVPPRDWGDEQKRRAFQPPLAKELFAKRQPFDKFLAMYPQCAPLVGELRDIVGRDQPVEEALRLFREMADTGDVAMSRQLMALRYYIALVVGVCGRRWTELAARVTNYAILVNLIERERAKSEERVLLVTFNYDVMLEDGLSSAVSLTYDQNTEEYVFGPRPYMLIKPHGSVTWERLVTRDPNTSAATLINEAYTLQLTDFFVGPTQPRGEYASIPAIAVPTTLKSIFECPQDHIQVLRQTLPQVTRLLVIGWRAQEESFLEVLSQHMRPEQVQGYVVSLRLKSANEIAETLKEALPGAAIFAGDHNGFSAFVQTDFVERLWNRKLV